LNYEFLPQLYYFFGNLVFTVIMSLLIGTISDFPCQLVFRMLRPKEMMDEDERMSLRETFIPNRINNTTMMRDTTMLDNS